MTENIVMKKYSFFLYPQLLDRLRLTVTRLLNQPLTQSPVYVSPLLPSGLVKKAWRPYLHVLTALLITSLLSNCGGSSAKTEESASTGTHRKNNLLATATYDTAKLENVRNELNLTGKITFNQDQVVKVFPLVGGHIETLKADLGDYVQKGQIMAVIRSGDLADLEQQAVSARGQLAVAQKNQQVTEDMTKAA